MGTQGLGIKNGNSGRESVLLLKGRSCMLNAGSKIFECYKDGSLDFFNFTQDIWLSPEVRMSWSDQPFDLAAQTLSLNILSSVLGENTLPLSKGLSSQTALELYERFTDEIVSTIPCEGGLIPLTVVSEWIERNIQHTPLLKAG